MQKDKKTFSLILSRGKELTTLFLEQPSPMHKLSLILSPLHIYRLCRMISVNLVQEFYTMMAFRFTVR